VLIYQGDEIRVGAGKPRDVRFDRAGRDIARHPLVDYFGPVERRLEAGRLVLLTDARRLGVCLSLAESCW
jgi:hypothetical protein